jgi:hypothetical protein
MKKVIGVLGIVAIAATIFLSNDISTANGDLSLVSLIKINNASAESGGDQDAGKLILVGITGRLKS